MARLIRLGSLCCCLQLVVQLVASFTQPITPLQVSILAVLAILGVVPLIELVLPTAVGCLPSAVGFATQLVLLDSAFIVPPNSGQSAMHLGLLLRSPYLRISK